MVRLAPSTDTVPASVNKYLLPYERHVISVHEHPAVLIPRTLLVLAGLALAGWLSNSVTHGNGTAILVIWVLWALLVLWLAARVADWWVHYFVVTSQRLMLAEGILIRKVNMIPLSKVSDIEFRKSAMGRLLGYGEFEVLAPGMGDKMRYLKFLPYSEQLYLEVCGLIFTDRDEGGG